MISAQRSRATNKSNHNQRVHPVIELDRWLSQSYLLACQLLKGKLFALKLKLCKAVPAASSSHPLGQQTKHSRAPLSLWVWRTVSSRPTWSSVLETVPKGQPNSLMPIDIRTRLHKMAPCASSLCKLANHSPTNAKMLINVRYIKRAAASFIQIEYIKKQEKKK